MMNTDHLCMSDESIAAFSAWQGANILVDGSAGARCPAGLHPDRS